MKHKLDSITLSGIRMFSQQYRNRENMVYLTIGEPNLNTPQAIKDAAMASLENNNTHYPHAMGDPLLREAIANHESSVFGESFSSDQILVTNGATEGLILAFGSLLEAGDEAIILVPSFPLYQTQVALLCAKPVLVDLAKDDFQLTMATIESYVNEKTKCIVLASPNNPTGTLFSDASYEVIRQLMMRYPDLHVIVDEVYRTMVYDVEYNSLRSIESIRDRIVIVSSFSKSHAMTGWRVGYVIAPLNLVDRMHKLHQNIVTGISSFTQTACITALSLDTQAMVDEYQVRRDYVLAQLDDAKVSYVKPDGAFYVFPDISEFGMGSIEFAEAMADAVGLVVIPGTYFGNDQAIRISYGESMDIITEGIARFVSFVTSLR